MKNVTFITGNKNKAEYLSKYLGVNIGHIPLDLDEVQSLSLEEIVEHKAKQAYQKIKSPVLVEDVGLVFEAMGRLPGPFIKFFIESMALADICKLLDNKSKKAFALSVFGYYDGETLKLFSKSFPGTVPSEPKGEGGFGWDSIFIPEGYTLTRAQMNAEDDRITYIQCKPFDEIRAFLE